MVTSVSKFQWDSVEVTIGVHLDNDWSGRRPVSVGFSTFVKDVLFEKLCANFLPGLEWTSGTRLDSDYLDEMMTWVEMTGSTKSCIASLACFCMVR